MKKRSSQLEDCEKLKKRSSHLEDCEKLEKRSSQLEDCEILKKRSNYPDRWRLLESMSTAEKKALVLNQLEQFRSGGLIRLVDVNNKANYIYDKQLQIHLPSKERKLKTIQPDNCERFEKTVAAVIAKLRENKDERVRSKNYKQFKTTKAWNDRLIELSVYLEIPKAYFGYSTKRRGELWGPMTIQLDGMTCNCLFPNTPIPEEFETLTLTNKQN